MTRSTRVKILLDSGKIVWRALKLQQVGNFVMATVRYNNCEYLLKEWNGDEYLRGMEPIYTLGKNLTESE